MKFYYKFEPLLDLRNNKDDIFALTGGRASGKTQHVIRAILIDSLKGRRNYCFFRETKSRIDLSIKKDVEEIINEEFNDRGFVIYENKISVPNGSTIYFEGLKEVNFQSIENLKGFASSIDVFIIDEAQAITESVLVALIETIRGKNSVFIVMYNRVKNDLPVEKQLFLDYKTMSAPEGTFFLETCYTDLEKCNLLPPFVIKRANLKKKNQPHEYEVSYLNKVDNFDDMRVIKGWTSDNVRPLFYNENFDLHISCDFNVDPMCWVFFHKTQENMYFFDELIQENTTTQLCANEIIRRYPNHKGEIILNGDSSGNNKNVAQANPDITNYILIKNILENYYKREVKIEIRKGNPHIRNRHNAFNERVCDIYGNRHIYFDPRMKWSLYNIENVLYKQGTTTVDIPTSNDIKADIKKKFLVHPLDAFTYPVEYYFPVVAENKV